MPINRYFLLTRRWIEKGKTAASGRLICRTKGEIIYCEQLCLCTLNAIEWGHFFTRQWWGKIKINIFPLLTEGCSAIHG